MLYTEYADVLKGLRDVYDVAVSQLYPNLDKKYGGIEDQFQDCREFFSLNFIYANLKYNYASFYI